MRELLLLAFINGLLFALPFLFDPLLFLIFFSLTFLFYNLEKRKCKAQIFIYLAVCVSVWQIITLSWLHHDNEISFWSTNIIILFLIAIPLLLFLLYFLYIKHLRINRCWKYSLFTALWVLYEVTFFEWELRFPVISLGVTLGNYPLLIQYYSYTGAIGGTIWILLINFVLLDTIKLKKKKWLLLTVITLPILLSLLMYINTSSCKERTTLNVALINLALSEKSIEQVFLNIEHAIDSSTNIILCPEGLLHIPSTSFPINKYFSRIKRLIQSKSENATMIFGCSSNTFESNAFIDTDRYNMIVQCDSSGFKNIRNKVFLVPFGEFIPYKRLLGSFEFIHEAVSNPIATNANFDNIFTHEKVEILPLICYELYFGNLIRRYFLNNPIKIICCVSNDYVIPNEIYYTQFMRASRIQSITFKTPVIKSSINGYSSIINADGSSISSNYKTNEVLKGKVAIVAEHTFYSKYGYLFVSILLLLMPIIFIIHQKL